MKVSKQEMLAMLGKIGSHDLIPEAAAALPDPVDIDTDGLLLARFGLERSQLMNRFGASP